VVDGFAAKRGRAAPTDRQEIVHGRLRSPVTPDAEEPFSQRLRNRASHCFTRFLGEGSRQVVGFGILDV